MLDFRTAEEEAEFWETHSPLDYPEYFEPCDIEIFDIQAQHWVCCPSPPFYRPDFGNLPLPFSLTQRNSQESDP